MISYLIIYLISSILINEFLVYQLKSKQSIQIKIIDQIHNLKEQRFQLLTEVNESKLEVTDIQLVKKSNNIEEEIIIVLIDKSKILYKYIEPYLQNINIGIQYFRSAKGVLSVILHKLVNLLAWKTQKENHQKMILKRF